MAIVQAFCTSAKKEFFDGVHEIADTYKCALYTSVATLGASTTAYSATNEVSGTGYTAGGTTLGSRATATGSGQAWLDFADAQWTSSTITARGALVYNDTEVGNAAIAVFLNPGDVDASSTNGTYTLVWPAAAASTAMIRFE